MINKCPAYGKACKICQNINHFASQCFKNKNKSTKIKNKALEVEEIGKPEEYMFVGSIDVDALGSNKTNKNLVKEWTKEVVIRNIEIPFKIDTGSSVNTLPLKTFNKLGLTKNVLNKTNVDLTVYTGNLLKILGKCTLPCIVDSKRCNLQFFVIDTHERYTRHY